MLYTLVECMLFITISDYHFERGQYRKWDEVNMMNAMLAVEKGNSLRHSAEMYGVPFGARSGPDTYLRVEEEEELTNFLLQAAEIGYRSKYFQ